MATRKKSTTTSTSATTKSSRTLPQISKKTLIVTALVVIIVVLIGIFRNQFVVANVNGQQVTRLEFIAALEKQHGQEVLQNLVIEKLIKQEAKNRKVEISDSELNEEVAKIEKSVKDSGQGDLDSLLAARSMTRDDLKKQLTLQVTLKKMIGSQTVSEKEIADYVEQNKQFLPEASDAAALKTQNDQVKAQLEQQKNDQKIQEFIAGLQSKAKIDYLLIKPAAPAVPAAPTQ